MKTLYISDLDGTLLSRDAVLSEYTVNALNKLIDSGMYFFCCNGKNRGNL